LHAHWKDVREQIEKRIKNTRLSDLARPAAGAAKRPRRNTLASV
jgi:hypothetical protein